MLHKVSSQVPVRLLLDPGNRVEALTGSFYNGTGLPSLNTASFAGRLPASRSRGLELVMVDISLTERY